MRVEKYPLSPPSLEELAEKLRAPLAANYAHASVQVAPCPDLRRPPFRLAAEGLCGGRPRIADVGGQPNLFPRPDLGARWSLDDIARAMDMDPAGGSLVGAGAGPFHVLGQNCELAPSLSWRGGFEHADNKSRYAWSSTTMGVPAEAEAEAAPPRSGWGLSPSLGCALMINLYGSLGGPGPVLKMTARRRTGAEGSFAECVRRGLAAAYGGARTVSLGGVFLVRSGTARYHVMPDFPAESELPFESRDQLDGWLTYHDFKGGPMVCLSVLHSADPAGAMGLRMEHTHCFSAAGEAAGGHYHFDVDDDDDEDIEYEAYFNTADIIYRVERPAAALGRDDLHDDEH